MAEFFRVMKLLIYKNLLIYKRQWYIVLIGHLLIPLGIFYMSSNLVMTGRSEPKVIPAKSSPKISKHSLIENYIYGNFSVYFAPNNSFTKNLVEKLNDCFDDESPYERRRFIPVGFSSEEDLLEHVQNAEGYLLHVSLIFEGDNISESTKHLKYKIATEELYQTKLYQDYRYFGAKGYYARQCTVQLQICLDEAFIKFKAKSASLPEVFVQEEPYPAFTEKLNETSNAGVVAFTAMVVIAFIIPLVVETSKVVREKLLGVNVLMSMNGVSSTLTFLSWLITGWIFISILCIIPLMCIIAVPSSDYKPAVLNYGNLLIIWMMLEIHTLHLLAYGIHACQYFSKYIIFIFCFLILNVAPIVIENFALDETNLFIVPYLGIFFPNLLLYRTMAELNYYEAFEEGIQWKNLFTVGNSTYEVGGSVGMIFILSIIGIIFQFFMAIYINAINPGKYGTSKHPLFFLKTKMTSAKENNLENVEYSDTDRKYFEPVSSNIYQSGIQIRNLKKTYNIGLISKKKIQALRGISIDFCKGQITSLLGHNGAGKTTMMSILTGMMSPSEGLVIINSKNIKDFQTEVMNDMGLCTQEDMFFPNLTVGEQFLFFAKLKGKGKSSTEITQNVEMVLEKLKLHDKRNALPNTLSGGQKRRLCFGMAIAGNPSTLILDEPTSGLDPESRRVIWDILLKMRGEKTILISTHDMEEADILGDRIAIIHGGKLKSYATPMFMKKLLGQGNIEVTLSIEPDFSIETIRNEFNCEMNVIREDSSKLILNIPNSPNVPDSLDNVQRKKKELKITGLSVSLISLEQAFLKITEESKDLEKSSQPITNVREKLTGVSRVIQIIRALFSKKIIYIIYNFPIIVAVLFWMFISLLFISMILKFAFIADPKFLTIPIRLDMYENPITFYQSYNDEFGQNYERITKEFGGTATDVKESNISDVLMNYGIEDLHSYEKRVIAAVELSKNETGQISANAIFSDRATFSFPISINLMSNTFLKTLVDREHSISTSHQRIMTKRAYVSGENIPLLTGYSTAFIFCFFLFTVIALFIIHPRQEAATNVKQLQRMSGASTFSYWGTMFISDFLLLLLISVLIIGGFIIMNNALDLRMFGEIEIQLLLLSIVLFVINILPLLYIFSFMEARVASIIKILVYVPLIFVIVEIAMIFVNIIYTNTNDENTNQFTSVVRKFQKSVFLIIPYISFLHSQLVIQYVAHGNARCRRLSNDFYNFQCNLSTSTHDDLCCHLNCYDGQCSNTTKYFNNFQGLNYRGLTFEDVSLEESLIYLCITPIIYFAILIILDNQLIKKLMAKVKKHTVHKYPMDEKVKLEKLMISQKISAINTNTNKSGQEFLVYELSKRYGNVIAVKDVSFSVKSRECFGLLGVNGAGKSTTFKMMTGSEIPDRGGMHLDKKNLTHHPDYLFSRMGYCPQNDALIKCFNSYDHLRLFARLRGVPGNLVEAEVKMWIQRLNLSSCASNACGTYSGGNKRRLNIAIALIGNPDLVLLDEPTTGVDPGARRSLWNVIQSCQASGQAVILTSHSMEECEALCNRLAIMVDGRFVCIGHSQELKQTFGAGYDIRIKMNIEKTLTQLEGIKRYMLQALNCELVDENMGYLMYHVKSVETTWRAMYDVVNAIKDKYDCIEDFSVLSSTLEQLFLLFARAANGDAQRCT